MLLGLDSEAWGLLGMTIGTAIGAIVLAIRGAKNSQGKGSGATAEMLEEGFQLAVGESRQIRQEVRVALKEVTERVERENRETRHDIASLRDILIEIRANQRSRS